MRVLTPTKDFSDMVTTMEDKTSTICLNRGTFSTHSSTGGFSSRRLGGTATCYRVRNMGICIAVGAVIFSSRLRGLGGTVVSTTRTSISTLVIRGVKMTELTRELIPSLTLRTSARVDVRATSNMGTLCRVNFGHIILTHRVDGGRVRGYYRVPIRLRIFIRNTLYVYISKRYCLDTVVNTEDKGHNSYTRPYQLPFSMGGRGNNRTLDLGSGDVMGCLNRLRGVKITSTGVRNEVGHPRCISTTMETYIRRHSFNFVDSGARGVLEKIFSQANFASTCCVNGAKDRVFNAEAGSSIISTSRGLFSTVHSSCGSRVKGIRVAFSFATGLNRGPILITSSKIRAIGGVSSAMARGTVGEPVSTRGYEGRLRGANSATCGPAGIGVGVSSSVSVPLSVVGSLHESILSRLSATEDIIRGCGVGHSCRVAFSGFAPPIRGSAHTEIPRAGLSSTFGGYRLIFIPLFTSGERLMELGGRNFDVNIRVPEKVFKQRSAVTGGLFRVGRVNVSSILYGGLKTLCVTGGLNFALRSNFKVGFMGALSLL